MIAGTIAIVIGMVAGRVKFHYAHIGRRRRPIESPASASLLARKSSYRSVLDVLARIARTGVVQYLRERIRALQVACFLISAIKDCQLKTPTQPGGIQIGMPYCDRVSLIGNIG